jgi:hypothetical protein
VYLRWWIYQRRTGQKVKILCTLHKPCGNSEGANLIKNRTQLMIFNVKHALLFASAATLTANTALAYRSQLPPLSPIAPNTASATPQPSLKAASLARSSQTWRLKAETAAEQGDYENAIQLYRQARKSALNVCDNGTATAGEIAALDAKEWLSALQGTHPNQAAENARMAYLRRFQQTKRKFIAVCD